MTKLSKRKLESYRRAEEVARISRYMVVNWHRLSQEDIDQWSTHVLRWMDVTGKIKYDLPYKSKGT